LAERDGMARAATRDHETERAEHDQRGPVHRAYRLITTPLVGDDPSWYTDPSGPMRTSARMLSPKTVRRTENCVCTPFAPSRNTRYSHLNVASIPAVASSTTIGSPFTTSGVAYPQFMSVRLTIRHARTTGPARSIR